MTVRSVQVRFLRLAAPVVLLLLAGEGCRGAVDHPRESLAERTPAPPDSLLVSVDTSPVYVGFLRKDALLVHVFRYRGGEWTEWADSIVPPGWTVYGYDRSVRSLQVGASLVIPDDEYDYWGRATDHPVDTTDPQVRPRTRVGIATTSPGRPYPLFPVDSGSAEWVEIARAAWSSFEGGEQRMVTSRLEQEVCAQAPPGVDCDGVADRRRLEAGGRLPGGHLIDSVRRARGTVSGFAIRGTGSLPGGLVFYHVSLNRQYSSLTAGSSCGPISYFTAVVVKQTEQLAVTNAEVALSDCDGMGLSGTTPLAVIMLGGRVFVMAEQWAWEEAMPVVRELTKAGMVETDNDTVPRG